MSGKKSNHKTNIKENDTKPYAMKQIKNIHGFTLMEVLIATAILGIVMMIVYGSFVQTRLVIGRTEATVDGLRGIRAVYSRITSDVGMAFLSTANDNTFFVGKDDYGA